MAKHYRRKKVNEKLFTGIFITLLILLVGLIIAAVVINAQPEKVSGYTFTADGHVHDATGAHVGDLETMLATGELTISQDGHIHDAAGNHVGDLSTLLAGTEATADPAASAAPEATAEPETPADPETPAE